MLHEIIRSFLPAGAALFLLRLSIGQIFLLHGSLKLMKKESEGTPKWLFLGAIEAAFGFLMIIGLWTWLASIIFIAIMLGAIYTKLFVWPDQKYAGSIEYDVLISLASLVILALGPGMLAIG